MLNTDRFETTFIREDGVPVRGVLQPVQDQKIYNDDFFENRQLFRVRPEMPVSSGQVLTSSYGVHYILGSRDVTDFYINFQAYPCNKQVVWMREVPELDLLTGLPISTGAPTTLGNIWVVDEQLIKETRSPQMMTKEDVSRIITASQVLVGDIIDDRKVRRVNSAQGIYILEVI